MRLTAIIDPTARTSTKVDRQVAFVVTCETVRLAPSTRAKMAETDQRKDDEDRILEVMLEDGAGRPKEGMSAKQPIYHVSNSNFDQSLFKLKTKLAEDSRD